MNTNVTQKIVEELASGKISKETALERLSENSKQPAVRVERTPFFKVTKSGAVSLFNVRRKPIVFYADQWDHIFSLHEEFQTYGLNEDSIKRR